MTRIDTDICIIGAGAGGLSVAAGAAQMGARVVLIEGAEMGGDCLNTGCVPSKALLAAGRAGLGWDAAHAHMRSAIAAIAPHDSAERFEGLGVTVLRGFARFTGRREVTTGDSRISARRFVIATGSRPFVPDIPGLDALPYLTNETLFGLDTQPAHLLVLGGGPVGLEMAEAHRRLGAEVSVIEAGRALAREDPEAVALVLDAMRGRGVRILEQTQVTAVRLAPEGVALETTAGDITGSHLLVATGRVPAVDGLGLDAAGVAFGPDGIVTDKRMRTSNRRIYAIGDVTCGAGFTHLAGYHAGLVLRTALFGLPVNARTSHIPRALHTAPEFAQVGLTEAEARATHDKLEVLRADLADNDRAIAASTTGRPVGFLKVMAVKGRPVGATMVGAGASEQIALWSLAISGRLKLGAIAGTILPYPTRAELSKRAAGAWFAPRLFDNPWVARMVRMVQRFLP